MIDLSHLKRLAGEATPGRWHWHGERPYTANGRGDTHLDGLFGGQWKPEDRAFIAAFNPEVAKRLIEALECAVGALSTINFPAIWLDEGSDGVVKCASEALIRISALIGKGEGAE